MTRSTAHRGILTAPYLSPTACRGLEHVSDGEPWRAHHSTLAALRRRGLIAQDAHSGCWRLTVEGKARIALEEQARKVAAKMAREPTLSPALKAPYPAGLRSGIEARTLSLHGLQEIARRREATPEEATRRALVEQRLYDAMMHGTGVARIAREPFPVDPAAPNPLERHPVQPTFTTMEIAYLVQVLEKACTPGDSLRYKAHMAAYRKLDAALAQKGDATCR
jgi:hypothetical protein